eukprot:4281528-Pleurochrysis_carterae.AAC.1
MGIDFEFTHAQKTPTGGYCLTSLDSRHYLPDITAILGQTCYFLVTIFHGSLCDAQILRDMDDANQ